MFGSGKIKAPSQPLACLLGENSYTILAIEDGQRIRFCEHQQFEEASAEGISKGISTIVEREHLFGNPCQVILSSNLYQLLLMDALEVPENEMAKAMRWQLKGMIDYPLNDIAVDTFLVPPHGAAGKRKSVFVAVTPQTGLMNKLALLERCLLNVTSVSIAELAMSPLLPLASLNSDSPCIVVSYDVGVCKIQLYYQGNLYLSRGLSINKSITQSNSPANQEMLLEIQRSIDFCLIELKLPEPKNIVFTPSFYAAEDLFLFLKEELQKDVRLLDISTLFSSVEPIAPSVMAESFYAIGGALMLMNGGVNHVAID